MKRNVIVCAIALFCTQAMSYTHSDIEMEEKIVEAFRVHNKIKPVAGAYDGVIGLRCPYDSQSDEYKFGLIDDAFDDGHYSRAMRDRLKAERLYPFLGWDRDKRKVFIPYLCKFGCFSLSTNILIVDNDLGMTSIKAKDINFGTFLAAFDPESVLDAPTMSGRNISEIIKSQEGEEETLLNFELSNGNSLKVTKNHGMLLSDGKVVMARHVKPEDQFVSYEGEIVSIEEISLFEQNAGVVNFRLEGDKRASNHIMGAEGVLIGDHAWQSDLEDDLNSIAIRRSAVKH